MLAKLDDTITEATAGFEAFDYARALERTESFFWWFCDNYVELVKGRAYGSRGDAAANSALRALREALSSIQRLFAPTLPFATEEAWSWWNDTSVHAAPWPAPGALAGNPTLIDVIIATLQHVRRSKTEAKQSQKAAVESLTVTAPADLHDSLAAGEADLCDAGSIATVHVIEGAELSCAVVLTPPTTE
jgi:valyl-tRNA synthetase